MWEDQDEEEEDNEEDELEGQLLSDLISSNKYGEIKLIWYDIYLKIVIFYLLCVKIFLSGGCE